MGKALWKCLFTFNRQQPEKYEQNIDVSPTGKISADADGKGAWGHSNEGLPITAQRNAAERSFSKLRLIKTCHR